MMKSVFGVMAVTVMLLMVAGVSGAELSEIKGRMAYRRGNAYRYGKGASVILRNPSPRNKSVAVEWFEAASESGSDLSTYILGDMKCAGRIPGGQKEGHRLIEKAAEANCISALKKLKKL